MCLNDKEFAIEFFTVNLITLLSTLWGEIFAVFHGFTEKPPQKNIFPNKVRRTAESVSLHSKGFYK